MPTSRDRRFLKALERGLLKEARHHLENGADPHGARREGGSSTNAWGLLARGLRLPATSGDEVGALLQAILADGRLQLDPATESTFGRAGYGAFDFTLELARKHPGYWGLAYALMKDPSEPAWAMQRADQSVVDAAWRAWEREVIARDTQKHLVTRSRKNRPSL